MEDKFYVFFTIANSDGEKMSFDATVEFCNDPEDYGNGYHMGIRSKSEAFGLQGYDIRYDRDFREDEKISYIVQFYARRYSGKDGAWKLTGISVVEGDEQEK